MTDNTQEDVVQPIEVKTKRKGRPSKKAVEVSNVETIDQVTENVEILDIVVENVEPTLNETPLEFTENTLENVEEDLGVFVPSAPVMDETVAEDIKDEPVVETVKKVLRKVPDNFDIVKWRRLGRR